MKARTAFAWILVAVLAVITWLLLRPFLSWLLATGLLAFVLFPVHSRLEDRIGPRISAGLLSVLVVLVVVVPVTVGANVLVTEGTALLEGVSRASVLDQLERLLERNLGIEVDVRPMVEPTVDRLTDYVRASATTVVRTSLHAFIGFLLLIFVLYYLLKDGRLFVAWLKQSTPLDASVRDELFASADAMVWAVLKGHVLVAIIQGSVAGVSLFLTGVPRAPLLTVAMMVLAIVPLVGVAPVLGGAVVYLFVDGRVLAAAFVVVWGMTSVAVTDDYLRALLIDRESEMHSAVILVGVAGGTYLLGVMGLFLGPILIGLFKTTVEVLGRHHSVTHDD
ncbi:AI-2E family transporter [Halomicrococcus gelatinilyticus]|uniref:AI-2E family transporter n=1 Tax=Halomicrococcus gelatinilyticus TaxID=1702103 RepID=UPI002E134CE2